MRSIKLAEKLTTIAETMGALIMLSLLLFNFLQVFFRYVLVEPIGWTEEVMRYSVSWMTFLLAGAVLFRGEQLAIDMFSDFLPPRFRKIQCIFVLLSISMFCLVLVAYGYPQAVRNMKQFSPVSQIPMIIPYMSVVVGGLLLLVKAIILMLCDPERLYSSADDTK